MLLMALLRSALPYLISWDTARQCGRADLTGHHLRPACTGLQAAKQEQSSKPVVGVLGCMAERLKTQLLRKGSGVDLVVGPDAYRDLPRLLSILQVAAVLSCLKSRACHDTCLHVSLHAQAPWAQAL